MTWAGVLAFLRSLPGLFATISLVITSFRDLVKLIEKAKREKWIKQGREIRDAIKTKGKTDAELRELVRDLARHTSSGH